MVEFCRTKMETRSCKCGFICWCIFGRFLAGKSETFYLQKVLRKVVYDVMHNLL